MRSIKKIHSARYAPIADLTTYSPLPNGALSQIDPFLFLNHHGPQIYQPNNDGLPFGPHPHRGMETVTIILDGDIYHKDNCGHESIIGPGGIQWMTAGRGLVHAEVSSNDFKNKGGKLEILQLWLNLPARLKMTEPSYRGLSKEEISVDRLPEGGEVKVISGAFNGVNGVFHSLIDVTLLLINLNDRDAVSLDLPESHNVLFYVIKGELLVNTTLVQALHLVEFNRDGDSIHISASSDSVVLFGHALPLGEPVVARGPFVMNTEEEITQAYRDYRSGKFGELDL